jgi:hypothetical protein
MSPRSVYQSIPPDPDLFEESNRQTQSPVLGDIVLTDSPQAFEYSLPPVRNSLHAVGDLSHDHRRKSDQTSTNHNDLPSQPDLRIRQPVILGAYDDSDSDMPPPTNDITSRSGTDRRVRFNEEIIEIQAPNSIEYLEASSESTSTPISPMPGSDSPHATHACSSQEHISITEGQDQQGLQLLVMSARNKYCDFIPIIGTASDIC